MYNNNEQLINHFLYVDDICVLVQSANRMQRLLDVNYNFSIRNNIMLNSNRVALLHNKLYCSNVRLHCSI